jgi:hypothetical protein
MREFQVIDTASSIDKLRMRLKDDELEQYGDPLLPEDLYNTIRVLPRFSSMRVSCYTFNYDSWRTRRLMNHSEANSRMQKNF